MEINTLPLELVSSNNLKELNRNQEPTDNLLNNFKLSDLFKDFNSSNVDDFIFDDVSLSMSSSDGKNSVLFSGNLRMDGALSIFKEYVASDAAILVTASISTEGEDISEKMTPKNAIFTSVISFHKEIFKGATLVQASFELDVSIDGDRWIITPKLTGEFDVDDLTDKDEGKIRFELTEKDKTLILNANAKNLNGAFGIEKLTLDTVSIQGQVGATDSLSIHSELIVGQTTFDFEGVITPDVMGIITKADSFTLNDLGNLFNEISATGLMLPEFGVDFKNTSIAFSTKDTTIGSTEVIAGLSLMAEVTAHDHTMKATAHISNQGVVFDSSLGNLTLGPVAIKNTDLDFQIYNKSVQKPAKFEISGDAVIEGLTVDCGVYFEKNTKWTTVLYANLAASSFGLSTVFPKAKGSFLDELKFSKAGFVYASADCITQNEGVSYTVKKGLQLIGVLEEIPGLSQLTGEKQIGLVLSAHYGPTTSISIEIPDTRLDLGPSIVTDPFRIQINITPEPEFLLVFGMDVSIPNQSTPLHFDMGLSLGALEATGFVTMKNYWKNPFGINGVKIGPALAMQLGIFYPQFVATGIPSELGIAGGLAIGDTVVDMAVNISTNPMELILMGKLENLSPAQLINFAGDLMPFEIPDVPDFFEIQDLELYCAPAGGSIGTIIYEPGFSFSGDLVIAGKKLSMYTRISDNGVEGAGYLDRIEFGPLEIGGLEGKDAQVELELSALKQSLMIDGSISFLGLQRGVFVDVSKQGIAFRFSQDFFGKLKFEIAGASIGSIKDPKSLDFQLSGEMQNDITEFLKTEVATKIDTVLKTTEEDIEAAQDKVDKTQKAYEAKFEPAQKALTKAQKDADAHLDKLTDDLNKKKADYNKELTKAQNKVKKAKGSYDKAFTNAQEALDVAEKKYNSGMKKAQDGLDKAEKKYNDGIKTAQKKVNDAEKKYKNGIGSAQNAVNNASKKVNSLHRKISNVKKKIKKLKWYQKPLAAVYGAELAGLYTAFGTAKGVLEAANIFLEGIKYGVEYTAFEAAQAALHVAKTGANYTAFKAAEGALHVAKTGTNFIAFDGARKALEVVRFGSEYTVWQAAEKGLSAIKIAGEQTIAIAGAALNNIGQSAAYIALEVAKGVVKAIENGTEAVAFETAKAVLEAAKLGSKGILELAEYIATHAGDIIDIKSFKFSGSLKEIKKGNLFDAELDIALLGKNYHFSIDFDVENVSEFVETLFKKTLKELKSLT